jgi:hypothetical protein
VSTSVASGAARGGWEGLAEAVERVTVGIFGDGMNENEFGLNSGALALSGLPNEALRA